MRSDDSCLNILEAVIEAAPHLRHVRIDADRLAAVCAAIAPSDLKLPTWDFPVFCPAGSDALAGQILRFNAVNFCYWGDPPWEVEYAGQRWGGSLAMLACIRRGQEEGALFLEGQCLARLREADTRYILRDSKGLRLVPERLAIWRVVGQTLVSDFGGRFTNVIARANGDAVALMKLLVARFPSFDDVRTLDGLTIPFHKRAQLAAAMLFEAFGGQGWGQLARTDQLTVFADYKLPQVLRRLGILVYDEDLATTVDSQTLIPAGDRREVEIRIATVWAAELMRRALAPRLPWVTALHLDYWLWYAGRQQGAGAKPYHRTLTTAY